MVTAQPAWAVPVVSLCHTIQRLETEQLLHGGYMDPQVPPKGFSDPETELILS